MVNIMRDPSLNPPVKPGHVRFFYMATLQFPAGGGIGVQTLWGTMDALPGITRLQLLHWFLENDPKARRVEGPNIMFWQCEPDTYAITAEPEPGTPDGWLPGQVVQE